MARLVALVGTGLLLVGALGIAPVAWSDEVGPVVVDVTAAGPDETVQPAPPGLDPPTRLPRTVGPRFSEGVAPVARRELLPAARGWRERREHCPAPTRARVELLEFEEEMPVWRSVRRPHYRVTDVPIFVCREVPVFQSRRVPRYEDVVVSIYGWRDVPNVVTRLTEVYVERDVPNLVERKEPAKLVVHEPIFEYGEEQIEETVQVPRVEKRVDPRTGCEVDVVCGSDEETRVVGTKQTKRLTGWREEERQSGFEFKVAQEGTKRIRVFDGVHSETVVDGTRRERVVVGQRTEKRLVGWDEEKIACGTRIERVQRGARQVREQVGWFDDRERDGSTKRDVPYDVRCIEEPCGSAQTVPLRVPACLPERYVTVVPNGASVGVAPLPGTDAVLTESEWQAERARRSAGATR